MLEAEAEEHFLVTLQDLQLAVQVAVVQDQILKEHQQVLLVQQILAAEAADLQQFQTAAEDQVVMVAQELLF
jgi:hypothetical protein